jgi:hypothetical protein
MPAAPSPEAQAAMEAFSAYVGAELRAALQKGIAVSMMQGDRVVWMHPDGVLRLSADPSSPKA